MNQWHYALNGQQFGPVPTEEIQRLLNEGVLNRTSLVWREGLANWMPISAALPDSGPLASSGNSGGGLTSGQTEQVHPFEFRGNTGEYFRIWIVNVVLTVITLGIYAAWAKVRTRRYFYGNTLLDGKPFEFTGNPIAILKGNVVFGGLFLVYITAGKLMPPLALLVGLLIFIIAPWLITKALRFRAHNTMHRNVRFNFRGATDEAYSVFLGLAILVPFTLGLLLPYVQFRQRQFILGNMGWGNTLASMQATAGFWYKCFFKALGVFIVMMIAISAVMPAIMAAKTKAAPPAQTTSQAQQRSSTQFNSPSDDLTLPKNRSRHQGPLGSAETGIILGMVVPIYVMMFGVAIWFKVRTSNFAINNTQWGSLGRIHSTVRVRDLMGLYITNGLAVLFSLGLAIPWVKIRMARYNTSRNVFIASGSLDAVAQSYTTASSAMGDAGADIFEVEVGF